MTCEWAEEHLSAYLDDALDPQLRKDVGAHIDQCARCQALAAEYRRNDQLVTSLTPLAPSDDLRQRIFASPEFAALTRELERVAADASPGRRPSRRMPLYLRALVPAAALLMLSLGAALLFRQGLFPFSAQPTSQKQTHTIGGPSGFALPLSAGPRLVYLYDGVLWSVAEYAPGSATNAPGSPQQLTATSARVAGWSVSPVAVSGGGARIAYIDARTGALHVVHSDGQSDVVVGYVAPTHAPSADFWSSAAGHETLAGLAWSPDSARLAWVSVTASGDAQAHSYQLDGSAANTPIYTATGATISRLTWSANGSALAFTTNGGSGDAVVVWRGAGQPVTTLSADPHDPQAAVSQLAWGDATLTWATTSPTRNGAVSGVYSLSAGGAAAKRLTPGGASYSAAAFTPARGGVWLLAGNGKLSQARLTTGAVATQVASLSANANAIIWSPNGATAALLLGNQLTLWSASNTLTPLIGGVTTAPAPVWSSDSASLAVIQGQDVSVYQVSSGATTQVAQLSGDASPRALAWATDGRTIAIAETQGTLLVASNGTRETLLTSHPADGAVRWSLAG